MMVGNIGIISELFFSDIEFKQYISFLF